MDFIHVQGHQDSLLEIEQLNPIEKMNVLADTMAKHVNTASRDQSTTANPLLYNEYGPITLPTDTSKMKFFSDFKKSLYTMITEAPTRSYWMRKMNISTRFQHNIAWDEVSKAFRSLPTPKNRSCLVECRVLRNR